MEKLNFKVSSDLKSVIGRDLITNDFVAIFELVKNSADAGAQNVEIIIDLSTSGEEKIIIADDGKGMSREDIENKWLFVAYSAKKDGSEDADDKVYAGNKGIGRFACDRLGSKLLIQARTKVDKVVSLLSVDWGLFEGNSQDWFTDVEISYSQQGDYLLPNQLRDLDQGVIVEISDLREPNSWDRKKILSLKQHLAKLLNPFGGKDDALKVTLHAPTESVADKKSRTSVGDEGNPNIVNSVISNNILDILEKKTTRLSVSLEGGYFLTELYDRSELIYKIREQMGIGSHLKNTAFKCEVFYLNRSAKSTFRTRMGVHSIDFGSLFLFKNGFRVFPVGERGNDFWGIESRKAQGFARYLGPRDILGKVDIVGPETKFKEASSRDLGLIETQASNELIDVVVKKIVRTLELYVSDITWKDKLDQNYDTTERMYLDDSRSKIIDLVASLAGSKKIELLEYNENLISVLNEKSKFFESSIEKLSALASQSNNTELVRLVSEAQKKYEAEKQKVIDAEKAAEAEAVARQQAQEVASKEQALKEKAEQKVIKLEKVIDSEVKRNLFLVKSENRDKAQLESFIHQLILYASANTINIEDVIQDVSLLSVGDIEKENILNLLSDISQNNEKIITTSRFATSANFVLDSDEIESDICAYISEYIDNVASAYTNNIKILYESEVKEFVTRFSPIELGMVIDNLISNSKKAKAYKVNFNMFLEGKERLRIEVIDDGRGLSDEISKDRIFEKGVTSTDGSGLGLYHAKKYIESIKGELRLATEQLQRGIKLVIRITK